MCAQHVHCLCLRKNKEFELDFSSAIEWLLLLSCDLLAVSALTYMSRVMFTVIIQTLRRVTSVIQNTSRLGGGSPPPNRPGRIGTPTWSGFGLPETLVRIQYLPFAVMRPGGSVSLRIWNVLYSASSSNNFGELV